MQCVATKQCFSHSKLAFPGEEAVFNEAVLRVCVCV